MVQEALLSSYAINLTVSPKWARSLGSFLDSSETEEKHKLPRDALFPRVSKTAQAARVPSFWVLESLLAVMIDIQAGSSLLRTSPYYLPFLNIQGDEAG